MKRGDIYIARLEEKGGSVQHGLRPVVILQNNKGNRYSTTTIVAAITSRNRNLYQKTHVQLSQLYGLDRPSIVLLEQIMTVEKDLLERRIGKIGKSDMARIDMAVMESIVPTLTEKKRKTV